MTTMTSSQTTITTTMMTPTSSGKSHQTSRSQRSSTLPAAMKSTSHDLKRMWCHSTMSTKKSLLSQCSPHTTCLLKAMKAAKRSLSMTHTSTLSTSQRMRAKRLTLTSVHQIRSTPTATRSAPSPQSPKTVITFQFLTPTFIIITVVAMLMVRKSSWRTLIIKNAIVQTLKLSVMRFWLS